MKWCNSEAVNHRVSALVISSVLLLFVDSSVGKTELEIDEMSATEMGVTTSFDKNRLWLPLSLTHLTPDLHKSAEIALSTPQCVEILRGELHEINPEKTVPIFKFICKSNERYTIATLVNGVNFKVINTSGETKLQQHIRHLNQYWKICQRNLHAQTEKLTSVRWPEGGKFEPSYIDSERVEYEIDFDAQGFGGEPLRYRGYCQFKTLKDYFVEVKPRPKSSTE